MEIKGTAVKTTPDFVKEKFGGQLKKWLNSLPPKSKDIMQSTIYATKWYSLKDSIIVPTEKIGELFFNDSIEAAMELGRYSADIALKGVYKIFVRISSAKFILSRATSVFSTYYNPADIKMVEVKSNNTILRLGKFGEDEKLIFYRIAGWLERTLEIVNSKNVVVNVRNKIENNELVAYISAHWD